MSLTEREREKKIHYGEPRACTEKQLNIRDGESGWGPSRWSGHFCRSRQYQRELRG